MKKTRHWLEMIRFAAAGGIVASALANITFSPSQSVNLAVALVAGLLTIVLVRAKHIA